MSTQTRPDHSKALSTVLKIVALAAGGLLLLLLILVVVGSSRFEIPRGVPPEAAGLAIGKIAPPIEAAAWINGEPDSNYKGQITVVQGWFYDCPYCWQEAPETAKLHAKYGDRVSFVALSPDPPSDAAKVQEFVDKGGLKFPVGYGALNTLIGFEASSFPVLWLVGTDGRVVWNRTLEGEQSLEDAIKAALNPRKA